MMNLILYLESVVGLICYQIEEHTYKKQRWFEHN